MSVGARVRRGLVTLPALLPALFSGVAWACTPDFKDAQTVESARYVLAWRTQPAPIVVGRHFSFDLVVCPKAGAPLPQSLRIDAQMPEHRHGMNYKPSISRVGNEPGRFRADGLMFHMPGRWELAFDLGGGERLTRSLIVE